MATVSISLKFIDNEGDFISVPTYWDVGDIATIAEAQAALAGLEPLVEALIGVSLDSAEVVFPLDIASVQNPVAGYSVWKGARLAFQNAYGSGDGIYIPGILESKIANKIVAANDADVAAFIEAASTATGFGANAARISSRNSASLWDTYVRGYTTTRKAR